VVVLHGVRRPFGRGKTGGNDIETKKEFELKGQGTFTGGKNEPTFSII